MKPKNEKEINNAFFQFLMLFLLTVAIVVVAVFFDYGFNWKDYGKVKEQYRERMMMREDTVMLIACALHNLKLRLKNDA